MTTPLAWVLSLVEIGSDGGIGASVRTPWAAAIVAKAMALATASAPSKKPSIGVLVVIGASCL